jgi:hypothetical protein
MFHFVTGITARHCIPLPHGSSDWFHVSLKKLFWNNSVYAFSTELVALAGPSAVLVLTSIVDSHMEPRARAKILLKRHYPTLN